MLTRRGLLVLATAVGMYLVGWGFGIREVDVTAVGLALAVGVAALLVRLAARRSYSLSRTTGASSLVEGEPFAVELRIAGPGRLVAPLDARLEDGLAAGSMSRAHPLVRRDGDLVGIHRIAGTPRGVVLFQRARLTIADPLGLAEQSLELADEGRLVVHPRISVIDRSFADATAALGGAARRMLLTRTSGFSIHGVREYTAGESLRQVHWPSTARRGQLMVKELEDAPRDEVAIVLDTQAGLEVGEAPDSSFEAQVRATASLLRQVVASGRRAVLVLSGAGTERLPVSSLQHDFTAALDLLAAVRPLGRIGLAASLAYERSTIDAMELVLVSSAFDGRLADRAVSIVGRRHVAICHVAAQSWRGVAASAAEAALVRRLVRSGVAYARIERGSDLAAALARAPQVEHAA